MKTLYFNAKIYLSRDKFSEAVLVDDGRIVFVGRTEEAKTMLLQGDVVEDLKGKTIIPGLNDSHMHLYNLGNILNTIDLRKVTSMAEMIDTCKAYVDHDAPMDRVIVGRGWNNDYFTDENRMPTRHDLDKITTEYPVILTRACGHLTVCNTRALILAGIDENTPQPNGAEFYTDEKGYPNGIFVEDAEFMVKKIIPPATLDSVSDNLSAAIDYAVKHGITSVQSNDPLNGNYTLIFKALRSMDRSGRLKARVYEQVTLNEISSLRQFLADGYSTGVGNEFFKVGPLKLIYDGSLGASTALLRNPYVGSMDNHGMRCLDKAHVEKIVGIANANGIQVAIHCIGDAAIQDILNIYEGILHNEGNALRHGIVHCQITDREILNRFKRNHILAYVQPIFISYDMHIVEQRCGRKLADSSYAFGSMIRMGIPTSYGTDCPVEDLNPFENIYCAVTRKDLSGNPFQGFHPDEKVDIYTAIDAYTTASAFCSFEEGVKGRIKEGYMADFAVLDKDIFSIPEDEIKSVRVLQTMVGGKTVYKDINS